MNGQVGDRPIRALFLSDCGGWGGSQKSVSLLLSGLDRGRFEPTVMLPADGALTRSLQAMNVDTIIRPLPGWVGPRDTPEAVAAAFADGADARIEWLASLIRARGIQVVVSTTARIADGAIAAHRAGVPHVWQVRELLRADPTAAPAIGLEAFYGLLTGLSAKVVAASAAVQRSLARFAPPGDVVVIHPGVPATEPARPDVAAAGRHPGSPKRLTFVGRVSCRKGVVTLVEAAALVLRRHADATFWLVGPDGGGVGEVAAAIRRLGVERQVFLLGPRNDVDEILRHSVAAVLPSVADAFPLVALEAMRAGVPVVATRSGGCEEIVIDGETGYLVPVGDAEALADRLCLLLDDPEAARTMGAHGVERVGSRFTHDRFVRSFEDVLTAAVADGQRGTTSSMPPTALALLMDAYGAAGRLHAARLDIGNAHAARAAAEQRREDAEKRLAAIRQSLAWRSTAPVRMTLDAIKSWCSSLRRRP